MAGMYSLVRPLLFRLNPETAHDIVVKTIGLIGRIHPLNQYLVDACRGLLPSIPVDAMGLSFPNPVGLAAGLESPILIS